MTPAELTFIGWVMTDGTINKLNNQITLENDYGKKEYKIVGIINDSRYVSDLERGTNSFR